jgi:hypothetical protein
MEVLATASHAEFITEVQNVEDQYYSPTTPILPSKGSDTTQKGGDGVCNRTQGNVDCNPEQTWVDSTQQPSCNNVVSIGETAGKSAAVERKIFSYHCFKHNEQKFCFTNP